MKQVGSDKRDKEKDTEPAAIKCIIWKLENIVTEWVSL